MSEYKIFHNPRCSKSRETLALLEEHGIAPEIVLYLEADLTVEAIEQLLQRLGISARDLIRRSEEAYKEQNLADPTLSEKQLIQAMANTPKLIERPIVVKGNQAVLGRPPERVLALIGKNA